MARDNSSKKRQQRQLARKQANRASYDRILIVTEGSKTEPNYFREIREAHRLHNANVQVRPASESGTAPIQVVEHAQELFENGDPHKNIQPRAFERVYAVFDRDDHDSYHNALSKAKSLDKKMRNDAKQPVVFQAIASVPSFELWLLLHFEDIQQPLHRDEVMRRLRSYIPDYKKSADNTYETTREKLPVAIQRAKLLATRSTEHTGTEPFTAVYQLVQLLMTFHGGVTCPQFPSYGGVAGAA